MKKLVALAAAMVLALSCVGGAMAETAYALVVAAMSLEKNAGSPHIVTPVDGFYNTYISFNL